MKILLFTLEYPLQHQSAEQAFYGGVANYYRNVVKYWPSLAKASGSRFSDIVVLDNSNNKLISKKAPFLKWLPSIWQLWQMIRKEKINYILVGHILPLGIAAYYVAKFTKTPYSVFLHGMDFTYALRVCRKKRIAKKILEKSDYIICASSYTADLVKNFLCDNRHNKIIIVNPGIDPRATHNMERVTQIKDKYNLNNKIVLFSIGRLVKRKGFDKVIEAMPKVLKSVPNLSYVIAGDGPDKIYFKEKAKGVKNIIFLGKISNEEKWSRLNLCDIFIMPARNINGDFEGFGIVYLEANLCGKPVIAGGSGGAGDAVENEVNGLLVDSKNINEIAEAIIKLAKDENLRKKLGKQGKERAVNKFNWEKQVGKIYKIINNK